MDRETWAGRQGAEKAAGAGEEVAAPPLARLGRQPLAPWHAAQPLARVAQRQ